ncbi:hypothetical protein ACX0AN_003725 [Acinetobacter baumannii]|uniref:Phage coat protein n=1 Tax=Acinetobacter baumannii TaxID=470 RepID=A0A854N5T0_ACIBA|nr:MULTISPECIES: hypothetical protein [Acinetobacter calcoaceticus/baumannii complex]EHU3345234.1 hypothetical protein [Acinetobacter baumannii]EKT8317611.1 hypothetical protein [Acinetobacter baumannii]EKU0057938.1 hypothetical protein [Acinetobacter baumannii]EKU4601242.1 hypothetical protein [Acinetobacter baumannii]EKU4657815.1 hypothetical protein [Acinetobacter baumannii]
MAKQLANKAKKLYRNATVATGVLIATTPMAFAADGDFDLTTGLVATSVIAGIVGAATLKALPTFTAWGVRKALSMLR